MCKKNYSWSIIRSLAAIAIFLASANVAYAAEFYLKANGDTAKQNKFIVDVYADAGRDQINAVSGTLRFSPNDLAIEEIQNGNSVINFWLEEPKPSINGINFAGITPGGWNGAKNLLFSIVFKAKKSGKTTIDFTNLEALKNDGSGSAATVSAVPLGLIISGNDKINYSLTAPDTLAPESFIVDVGRNPNIYNNDWFVFFHTEDKGGGLDHYEIAESKSDKASDLDWQRAESPYRLKDQTRKSVVFVKAVDKAGNQKIEKLSPAPKQVLNYWYLAVIILLIVLIFWRKKWLIIKWQR